MQLHLQPRWALTRLPPRSGYLLRQTPAVHSGDGQGRSRTRFRSWMWRRYPLAAEREGHAPREEHDCDEDGQAMLLTIHDVSRLDGSERRQDAPFTGPAASRDGPGADIRDAMRALDTMGYSASRLGLISCPEGSMESIIS